MAGNKIAQLKVISSSVFGRKRNMREWPKLEWLDKNHSLFLKMWKILFNDVSSYFVKSCDIQHNNWINKTNVISSSFSKVSHADHILSIFIMQKNDFKKMFSILYSMSRWLIFSFEENAN